MDSDQLEKKVDVRALGLRWVIPRGLPENQEVFIHVVGIHIVPALDYEEEFGEFYRGRVRKVFDEQEEVVGIIIDNFYLVEDKYLDNPRLIAMSDK